MYKILGTCSICSGAVTIPDNWMGTIPPIPSCTNCGATSKDPYGQKIDMIENDEKTLPNING